MRRLRHWRLLITGVGAFVALLGLAPAGASSANISHSYSAEGSIANGSIVSLDPQKSDYVQPANTDNGSRLLGVAVASNDSLLAVDANDGSVQVATSGTVNTLVSTLNGNINVGDQIGLSPFNGIGMKAAPGTNVIGLAQTGLNAASDDATPQQVTDKSGKTSRIQVGYIRISIAIGTSTASTNESGLNSLQKLVQSLTGRTVSTIRIVLSLMVAVVALLSLVVLTYASIFGSIISIGRNPLAKYAVFRALGSALVMVGVTAGVAALTIFFLLR